MDTKLMCLLFFLSALLLVSNHTGRIKVVFTPSICKVTCTRAAVRTVVRGTPPLSLVRMVNAADTLTATNFRVGEFLHGP